MTTARQNWIDTIRWQSDFYLRAAKRERTDPEFEWAWYSQWLLGGGEPLKLAVKRAISRLPLVHTRWHEKASNAAQWMDQNAGLLWSTRSLLEDELSKVLYDAHLVLRICGYERFYYPRIDFEDFVTVERESAFEVSGLPSDYVGLPIKLFDVKLAAPWGHSLKVVSTHSQIHLTNSYRQYFVTRSGLDSSPKQGDVVLDCGACIGDLSLVFAAIVGSQGEVHLFDPVPLHARYCELQGKLNPGFANVLKMNVVAVGDVTREVSGSRTDSAHVQPGGLAVDAFSMTTLDDYASAKKLRKVDLIKMDIEGAERGALQGAASVIREFRPKLTISAYHRTDDLWVLADGIKSLNPGYKLYFGHHSPVAMESVYYAVQPGQPGP